MGTQMENSVEANKIGAQRQANLFWSWALIALVVWYFGGWWAAIPGALALVCAVASVMYSIRSVRAEKEKAPSSRSSR